MEPHLDRCGRDMLAMQRDMANIALQWSRI